MQSEPGEAAHRSPGMLPLLLQVRTSTYKSTHMLLSSAQHYNHLVRPAGSVCKRAYGPAHCALSARRLQVAEMWSSKSSETQISKQSTASCPTTVQALECVCRDGTMGSLVQLYARLESCTGLFQVGGDAFCCPRGPQWMNESMILVQAGRCFAPKRRLYRNMPHRQSGFAVRTVWAQPANCHFLQ
jgi:hypothetical protein